MKVNWMIPILALALCVPVFADDAQEQVPDEPKTAAEDQAEEQSEEPKKTPEEVAAQVESMGEALTETRNTVELLNRLKVTGYVQAQFVDDERSRDELAAGGTRNLDQFSIRRGRVKFTYQATPTSKFVIQPDITSSGVVLKDGYVELSEPWTTWKHTLTAGQFNWPFGFEIMYSSSQREVPERSRMMRTLFPGERDRGVMLSGLGLGERFSYRVAIVNGTGTNSSSDLNQQKDFVGRLGWSFGALDVGGSVYKGEDLVATATKATGVNFDKERLGVDFQWATPLQGLGLRGEYITGKQAPASGTTRTESHDVDGWYFYAIQNLGTRHQLALRLDEYDPDTDVDDNTVRTINPSYIFHWDAHSKIMASYELIENEVNDPDDNVFTLRYQFAF
ncbi:MAG TPA: porin [Thermoanaerobaculia bacterium]|nr:porin [Thermoanaerobaculia bacterium]